MKNKVLTIIPSLYGGGAEKVAADISYALTDKYDHTIVTYNQKGDKYKFSAKHIDLSIQKFRTFLGRFVRMGVVFYHIKKNKKNLKPLVSISHMLISNMLNVLTKRNNKTICILHGEWSVRTNVFLLDELIKKQYLKADCIISVSHYIKNMFEEYYQLNNLDYKHEVVHIGGDIKEIQKKSDYKINENLPDKFLVYVAGFRKVKNHIDLLEKLEVLLKETDFNLVLVGDGELRKDIQSKIIDLNLTNKVVLLGNIPNPYPVIKKAFLSLLASSSESFSLVVLESMALGIPVISTDCGGPREIIAPNLLKKEIDLPLKVECGFLIDKINKIDKSLFYNLIRELENNKELYESMSKNSVKRSKELDIASFGEKLIYSVENLINTNE